MLWVPDYLTTDHSITKWPSNASVLLSLVIDSKMSATWISTKESLLQFQTSAHASVYFQWLLRPHQMGDEFLGHRAVVWFMTCKVALYRYVAEYNSLNYHKKQPAQLQTHTSHIFDCFIYICWYCIFQNKTKPSLLRMVNRSPLFQPIEIRSIRTVEDHESLLETMTYN